MSTGIRYDMPTREFQAAWINGTYEHRDAQMYAHQDEMEYVQGPRATGGEMMQFSPQLPRLETRAPGDPYDPDTLTFSYITEYNLNGKSAIAKPQDVIIRDSDLTALWARNNMTKHLKYDLRRVIPLNISIGGTTLDDRAPYSIQVFDANDNHLYDSHGANSSGGETTNEYGWPLYISDKTIYRSQGKIPEHYRDYANVKIEDIKKDVAYLEYPNNGPTYVLVPRKIGYYYSWVLEVRGNGQDDILNNPAYQDAYHKDYIKLTPADFQRCIKHYEEALASIKFHNMERIRVRLIPHDHNDPSDETRKRHSIMLHFSIRAPQASPEVIKQRMTLMKMPSATPTRQTNRDYDRLRKDFK